MTGIAPVLISRKNTYVGQKRNHEMEIINTIHVKGQQDFESQVNILKAFEF